MQRIASVEEIRSHFPALERKHNGHAVAYFDGPGGTQVPRFVGNAMTDYLYYHNANTHWAYPVSAETDEILEQSREAFADFLNASPNEIAFGANMTSLTMHLGRALAREMSPGDELLVTELDHHANVDPWRRMALESKMTVRSVQMNTESGQINWEDFESQVTDRTKVIAIGAASNALGTINDIKRAVKIGHAVGAYVFVDAVHYAPHNLVDIDAIGCDFLACSAYKFYGPHVGILYGKHALIEALDVARLVPAPNQNAERLETGTQNHEGIAGAAAAVNFLANLHPDVTLDRRLRLSLVYEELERRAHEQVSKLWNGLHQIDGVKVYGPALDVARTSTLSFTVAGISSEKVTALLADEGLFTSHGDFYATTVVQRLGLSEDGLVRAGCACYTTDEEIDRLVAGVQKVAKSI
ncbi:MAG: cysteine desulfurase-like protein [Rhodothermales bacterium]